MKGTERRCRQRTPPRRAGGQGLDVLGPMTCVRGLVRRRTGPRTQAQGLDDRQPGPGTELPGPVSRALGSYRCPRSKVLPMYPVCTGLTDTRVTTTDASVALTDARVTTTGASVASTDARVSSTGASVGLTDARVTTTGASVALTDARVGSTGASVALTDARVGSTGVFIGATRARRRMMDTALRRRAASRPRTTPTSSGKAPALRRHGTPFDGTARLSANRSPARLNDAREAPSSRKSARRRVSAP